MTKKPFGEPVHANAPDPQPRRRNNPSSGSIDDAADILRTIEGEAAYREVLEAARSLHLVPGWDAGPWAPKVLPSTTAPRAGIRRISSDHGSIRAPRAGGGIRRDRSGDPHGSDAGLRARSAPASREVQSSVGV
jgi:hypothetical protein